LTFFEILRTFSRTLGSFFICVLCSLLLLLATHGLSTPVGVMYSTSTTNHLLPVRPVLCRRVEVMHTRPAHTNPGIPGYLQPLSCWCMLYSRRTTSGLFDVSLQITYNEYVYSPSWQKQHRKKIQKTHTYK